MADEKHIDWPIGKWAILIGPRLDLGRERPSAVIVRKLRNLSRRFKFCGVPQSQVRAAMTRSTDFSRRLETDVPYGVSPFETVPRQREPLRGRLFGVEQNEVIRFA